MIKRTIVSLIILAGILNFTNALVKDEDKSIRDSLIQIVNKENISDSNRINNLHKIVENDEVALKDQELKIKERQLRDEESIIYLFIALTAMILVFSSVVFYFFKQKQRSARELKLLNAKIDEARMRAERNEKFKEQFLADMSHEIRTPLNTIVGMTDLMLDEEQSPGNEIHLKNIKQAGEHLLMIINDILDLSKAGAGKLELVETPFALRDFIAGVREMFQFKALEKNILLITSIEDMVPNWLLADHPRLRQVLVNLVGNAVKFTTKGSVAIRVTSNGMTENKHLIKFCVEDTGPGISYEQQPLIFEEFVQSPGMNEITYTGTGLGLPISKKLVERMGGILEVESQPGIGSCFFFTLPVLISSEREYMESRKESAGSAGSRKGVFRILVVEDNPSNLIVTVGHLENILPESIILTAKDGYSALEILGKEKVELILMDVQMPGIDGLETTRRIREMKNESAEVPIIALTASVIRIDIQQCIEAGMNGYIPKPISRKVMARTIFGQLGLEKEESLKTVSEPGENFLDKIPVKPEWASGLLEICNGKKERFTNYLEIFIRESDIELPYWVRWTEQAKHEELALSIHKMTSMIKIFTDDQSHLQAITLSESLKTNWDPQNSSSVIDLFRRIKQAHMEARGLLNMLT